MFKTGDPFSRLVASNTTQNIDDISSIHCEWEMATLGNLKPEHVRIRVHFSSINYKDALAITGKGKILRALPLTPGIDAAGVVIQSLASSVKVGEEVIITGCGIGEHVDGGLSQVLDVPANWIIKKPKNLSLQDCMILGTAGFTAGLALHQLEHNGLVPGGAPVLVTGATGGVGSLSLLMFKSRGYTLEAWTRKESEVGFLKSLGADVVTNISALDTKTRPLESGKWAAAIDSVGGDILSYILPRIEPHGSVASIGLAKSAKLETTVFPFILRGVNMLGISSGTCPRPLRENVWATIDSLDCDWSKSSHTTLQKKDVIPFAQEMVAGHTTGRALVDVRSF